MKRSIANPIQLFLNFLANMSGAAIKIRIIEPGISSQSAHYLRQ